MDISVWLAFFAASWAISLSPGPGAMAAMSAGLAHGWTRGMWTTVGLVLGVWTQVLVVGVGLGALIATSQVAFVVIKWVGVGYLVWLGVQQWRSVAAPVLSPDESPQINLQNSIAEGQGSTGAAAAAARTTRRALILRGWMINAVNPKGTAFILAVVPQFLNPTQPLAAQYAIIAITLAFTDLVVMAGYTALASRVLSLLRTPRQVRVMNKTFGALFVAAGVWLATFKRAV